MPDMLDWSAGLPEVTLPGGAVLIAEGEVHGLLYVLVDGAVEVSRAGSTLRVVDEPGAVFGEMSALLGGPATATVRAVRRTRLRRSDDGPGFLRANPAVTRARRDDARAAPRRHDRLPGRPAPPVRRPGRRPRHARHGAGLAAPPPEPGRRARLGAGARRAVLIASLIVV